MSKEQHEFSYINRNYKIQTTGETPVFKIPKRILIRGKNSREEFENLINERILPYEFSGTYS